VYVATPETFTGPVDEEQLVMPVTPVIVQEPAPVGTSALAVPVTWAVKMIWSARFAVDEFAVTVIEAGLTCATEVVGETSDCEVLGL
jgi:hypothetical protein